MTDKPIFLGYRAKRPLVPDGEWEPAAFRGVISVCSVSNCMAKPPDGWLDRWDWNRAECYESEDAAWNGVPEADADQFVRFAYRLWPVTRDREGHEVLVDLNALFSPDLPPLPQQHEPPGYNRIGFDIVGKGSSNVGFECSPLSCNGRAKVARVNAFCLVDAVEDALVLAQQFNAEQPEPGTYYVVEVLRSVG